ncbi:MAG: DUF423 domain-containing protein [Bacteroidetes bacterium]|nr:DUF423 domain-containing protein [Bacteroidota bacterium]
MTQVTLLFGSLYGLFAIILGAFGAHLLKKYLTEDALKSFETGVKYQLYHALLLLLIGFNFELVTKVEQTMVYALIIGTFLFSFSIYGLVLTSLTNNKWRFLGPVTPLGGLLLITGWILLFISFL